MYDLINTGEDGYLGQLDFPTWRYLKGAPEKRLSNYP